MSELSALPAPVALPVVVAWVAGALLLLAGGAKLRWPAGTVAALRDVGLPGGPFAVRVLGVAEVATGAAMLVAGGRAAAVAVAALYAAFSAFALRQRRTVGASCGCFGAERTPVSGLHVTANLGATVAAAAAALTAAPAPATLLGRDPVALVGTLVLVAVAAWLARLGLTAGADLQAAMALHPRTETTA